MTAVELIEQLSDLGIQLSLDGDSLKYRSPKGTLTAELKAAIGSNKPQIVDLLRQGLGSGRLEFRRNPEARFEPFPLTDLQQAYLIGERDFYTHSTVANLYQRYRVAELDIERFRAAVNAVVAAHDALRLTMLPDGQQRVADSLQCEVPFEDLRHCSEADAATRVAAMAARLAREFPSVSAGPMWNVGVQRDARGYCVHFAVRLLAFDAVTLHVVYRDLMSFYDGAGYVPQRPGLSYRDYVLGLTRYRSSAAYRKSLDFWQARLLDLPLAPELPRARVAPSTSSPGLKRLSGRLPHADWQSLCDYSRAHGRPVNTGLCAVYADTLARWARSPRFSLNMLSAFRPAIDADTADVVGNCSTTTVLTISGDGDTFAERVELLQRELYAVLNHNAVSGVEVIRQLARQRAFGGEPPMPVVFSSGIGLVGNSRTFELLIPRMEWKIEEARLSTPQVWLDHQVLEERGELVFNWDYSADQFPPGLVDDMFEHYSHHLKELAIRPAAWLERRHPLPTRQLAARKRANESRMELQGGTLHSLFEQSAAAYPNHLAILSPHRSLTYAEASARTSRVRQLLASNGVRAGDLVGVYLPKSPEQVIAVLGVLQLGAAYLPLDAKLPRARVRQILEHANARAVLTNEERCDFGGDLDGCGIVAMPTEWSDSAAQTSPAAVVPDTAIAYVIYTSGSTGKPKGVVIDHRGAVNTIRDVNRRFRVSPEDRILALSSLGFDLSVFDIFGAFAAAAAVVVPAEDETPNPLNWVEVAERFGASVWNSVPALMEMALDYLGAGTQRLSTLRLILLSGDWIPLALVRRLQQAFPKARIIGLGGATEASIWSNYFEIDSIDPSWTSVPYGFPLANQTFEVLDSQGEDTPTWVAGDLYIGGTGLAKGYLNDPDKTAASFVLHPQTRERLYRTGDRGCYMPDGALEFAGREDAQVKIRGYRVELGEIESVLGEMPGVEAAVAVVHGSGPREQRLTAFVVANLSAAELNALKQNLADRLPIYMVPTDILAIAKLPLSANGKVDRAQLIRTAADRPREQLPVAAPPKSKTERKLAELWQEVIGVGALETSDDFFALGGNSLQAVRLFSGIARDFGRHLPLSSLFQHRTLAAQAALIDRSGDLSAPTTARPELVKLKSGSQAEALVLLHPVGGDILCYDELVRQLEQDPTVYALRAAGLEGGATPRMALETTAAGYASLIASVSENQVVHLAGWSMGGVLAYECARQLRASGQRIGTLCIIDGWLGRRDVAPRSELAMLNGFFADLIGAQGPLDALGGLASTPEPKRLKTALERLAESGQLPRDLGIDRTATLYAVYSAHMRALEEYVPRPYEGTVTLIRAAAHDDDFVTLQPFWQRAHELLNAPCTSIDLPVDHYQVMRGTALTTVAGIIDEQLSRTKTVPRAVQTGVQL